MCKFLPPCQVDTSSFGYFQVHGLLFAFFFPKNHVLLDFFLDIVGYKFISFLLILLNLNIH